MFINIHSARPTCQIETTLPNAHMTQHANRDKGKLRLSPASGSNMFSQYVSQKMALRHDLSVIPQSFNIFLVASVEDPPGKRDRRFRACPVGNVDDPEVGWAK